jgi:phosphatidylinositol-3-phosphatase
MSRVRRDDSTASFCMPRTQQQQQAAPKTRATRPPIPGSPALVIQVAREASRRYIPLRFFIPSALPVGGVALLEEIGHSLRRRTKVFTAAAVIGLIGAAGFCAMALWPKSVSALSPYHFDRVVIIVLENYRSDKVDPSAIGPEQFTPFLNKLARENRLELNYFGVWRPSLPNYIAMIGGDFLGVSHDAESCFNPDHKNPCYGFDAPNLVDQLEEAHIAWEGLFESMPNIGFLGARFPAADGKSYTQSHNAFVYFKSIASDATRLAKLKPFVLREFKAEWADPVSASRLIFLVPNQCHNQHGTIDCRPDAVTLAAGDAFLAETVPAIINASAFTERSVLFITWDNGEGREACCSAWRGGGRIPFIAVTKHPMAIRSTTPSDHYSLLATIEDGFGLPRLGNARGRMTLFDLFPDFDQRRSN